MEFKDACPCAEYCPMDFATRVIGGKWKIKILCTLNFGGAMRYSELKRKVVGITPTMLANTLHELEEVGVVSRRQYDEMPVRVEYSLTEAGKSLIPILIATRDWSAKYGTKLPSKA
jgi:DNA-binding HxlR family transcriptional regulator